MAFPFFKSSAQYQPEGIAEEDNSLFSLKGIEGSCDTLVNDVLEREALDIFEDGGGAAFIFGSTYMLTELSNQNIKFYSPSIDLAEREGNEKPLVESHFSVGLMPLIIILYIVVIYWVQEEKDFVQFFIETKAGLQLGCWQIVKVSKVPALKVLVLLI
ncbi:hypothetical protein [Fulvivirga marina]|nr:hypothetical protein [Fulvivirga marina]